MNKDMATLPKKGLEAKPYSMDLNKDIATLTKKDLKTRPYNMDMATLPKKGLKTRPYNIGMEKRDLKKYDYTMYMEKEDLKKLSKGQLIRLLLKQEKKKPKVVIVNGTKPKRPNRPPPIPEGVKPFKPKQTVKLRRKQKVVDDRPGWVKNPKTNRWIKIDGPTYRKLYPMQHALNKIDKIHQEINNQSSDIDSRYQNIISSIDDVKPRTKITQIQKALKNSTKSFAVDIVDNKDPLHQLTETKKVIEHYLNKELGELKGFKYIETLKMTFEKQLGNKTTIKTAYFNSKTKTLINENEINEVLQTSRQELIKAIGQWISEGSGWTIQSVDGHYINLTKYEPLKGTSYIELPTELRNSAKGLINLKNEDNECFRWCHIRYLNPKEKDPQRIKKSDKEFIEKLDYSGIEFPITIKQINKIEKKNSIRINVFGYEEKQPYPIYISDEKYEDHMELLLITKDENKHYVLIKDFNKFMYQQTKHKERKHFCMHCLQCFSSERVLNNHKENCIIINGKQAINMPKKGENILKYTNHHRQQAVPFVIYADFEAITEKIQGCQPNNDSSYTNAYQKHTDCGYGYKVVCCYDDKYTKPINIYRGEKAVYKFMEKMLEEVNYCKNIIKKEFNKPLIMTDNDELNFKLEQKCHICEESYKDKDIRVRDHCHITGKYRGSAHQDCNLKLRLNPEKIKIPVIFHNLRGYDSHFIMQQIGEITKKHTYKNYKGEEKQMNINAIPNNMEKYMAFMLGNHLTFLDSFQFMSSSLDKLVSNLPNDALTYTSEKFQDEELKLMSQKGVYPYDYMDSFEKFDEAQIPRKEDFYSILNDQHISDEDYNYARKVWNTFKIRNMGQYHDLYLKSDILLLADVFENFRKTCLEYYKLDPCHYLTSPGLSWDAMLKMTDIKLELMTDIDMFQFIEKGMRGGISYIANRYGKANNKYMKEYDEKAPSKYIMYLDANNLYGWAMSQYLPTGGFKWMTEKQINNLDLAKYKENSKKGLILEVDLEYPKELHNLHNDYPLAAERVCVTKDMLSGYCKKIASKYNISTGLVSKLVPTLKNKEKYVLHYRNLQLYINLGLKVTKVHRVLEFNQSPWLKQYIDFNTEKRKNAKNAFEKDFFKLMNNSVFGKTMENLRKRVDVRLVTDEKKLLKLASKPTYVSSKIFNENLVAVHKIKETLTLNKPAYVGMCILDLSKTLMYDFHYNYIKKKYGDKARLLFTDTDSLTFEIEAEDVYKDFWNDKDKFDNSDYPESSPYFDKTNKKVIGKFKDEAAGVPICEFVGLRSKMYSYIKDDQKGGKTAKGIKKNVIKNDIKHENYKQTLLENKQMYHKMKTIRSNNHKLGSYEINKVSLSCFDDKRYILENRHESYAYGHYLIKN